MINIELTFTKGKITQQFKGDFEITLIVPKEEKNNIEPLNKLLNDDKLKACTIEHKKKKRSLNANAYCWKLCTEIANVLRASKDEIYIKLLKRYGQSSIVSVTDEAVPMFMKSVKYAEEFGHGTVNDKNFTHIKVFMGSSEYDTRQMSILIDGIVSEAKELKINTLTPAELEVMKGAWKGEKI